MFAVILQKPLSDVLAVEGLQVERAQTGVHCLSLLKLRGTV